MMDRPIGTTATCLRIGAVALVALAGACGGDDDGDDGVPPGAYCDPAAEWPSSAAALEAEILTIVNQHRAAGATCGGDSMPSVPPLSADPALRCAARVHTLDMAERSFFDHTNPDGQDPGDRIDLAGYVWSTWGENIAGGGSTAASTMEQWMSSPGHCSNIMSDNFVHLGVGHVESERLWTQVFGAPR
jgi:uncharacterized protein YkwD